MERTRYRCDIETMTVAVAITTLATAISVIVDRTVVLPLIPLGSGLVAARYVRGRSRAEGRRYSGRDRDATRRLAMWAAIPILVLWCVGAILLDLAGGGCRGRDRRARRAVGPSVQPGIPSWASGGPHAPRVP
jgi:hypothetical protein